MDVMDLTVAALVRLVCACRGGTMADQVAACRGLSEVWLPDDETVDRAAWQGGVSVVELDRLWRSAVAWIDTPIWVVGEGAFWSLARSV